MEKKYTTEGYDPGTGYGAKEGVETSWNRVFSVENTTALKNGTNCIAVEVHQIHEDSSDVYFDFKEFKGTPEWNEVEILDADGLSRVIQTTRCWLIGLRLKKEVIMYNTVEK